ncbi:MAG: hypothetical protein GY938_04155 [Ketobacter sp.]|nr:hypothetical protein [Ketobacter sp.]
MTTQEIPLWLGHLQDSVSKGLAKEHRDWWLDELAKSVSVNTDFQSALHLIQIAILEMALENKDQWPPSYGPQCVKAIQGVIDCHKNPKRADWIAAKSAADSAANSAVWGAAMSAAASADSADSATWKAAKTTAYHRIAKATIEILNA